MKVGKKMQLEATLEELEDFAFYESGLSADGCLNRLDDYAMKAIKKYGRILLELQENSCKSSFTQFQKK